MHNEAGCLFTKSAQRAESLSLCFHYALTLKTCKLDCPDLLDKSLAKLLALSKFPSRELDFKSYRALFAALAGCEFGP